MGTACPDYQPRLATSHRLSWPAAAPNAARRRSRRLPLSLAAVCLVWAIYWLPGIPLAALTAAKNLALLLMIGAILLRTRTAPAARQHQGRATAAWLLAIAGATFIGVAASPRPLDSLRVWARYPVALLVYLAVRQVYQTRPQTIAPSLKLLAVPVLLSVAWVFLARAGLVGFEPPRCFARAYLSDPHLMGLSYRTTGLAWSIAFIAPVVVYQSLAARRRAERTVWCAAAAACLLASFLLMNRGGLIAALAASALVGVARLRRRSTGSGHGAPVAPWVLALVLLPVVAYGASRFASSGVFRQRARAWRDFVAGRAGAAPLDRLSSGRTRTYGEALHLIARHPLAGVGFAEADRGSALTSSQAHNLYLGVALGAGALAGALVALFFLRVGLRWLQAARRAFGGRANPLLIVPLAMVLAHLCSTLIENGPMFSSLYLGISFWFALPALEVLLRQAELRRRPSSS